MAYLYSLFGSLLFGFGIYIFNKLDEKARRKGKWWCGMWGTTYTFWQFPMYFCFVALLICLLPFLEFMFN